jgi:hypothetical protein
MIAVAFSLPLRCKLQEKSIVNFAASFGDGGNKLIFNLDHSVGVGHPNLADLVQE